MSTVLQHLHLKNYKGFKDFKINFTQQVTVLVAPNGRGKSSVLKAVALCFEQRRRANASHRLNWSKVQVVLPINDLRNGSKEAELIAKWNGTEIELNYSLSEKGKIKSGHAVVHKFGRDMVYDPELLMYYSNLRHIIDIPLRIRDTKNTTDPSVPSTTGELNFRKFFAKFRNLEDSENEAIRDNPDYRNNTLNAIRKAINIFMPGYSDLRIRRKPTLRMEVTKEESGETLRLEQLSDGEKGLIALIGDIALNHHLNYLDRSICNGLVLIDEIDLFLHPAWQSTVVQKLKDCFPDLQFIITTHSPEVISQLQPDEVRILNYDKELQDIVATTPKTTIGLYSDEILEQIFGVKPINSQVLEKIDKIEELIEEEKFDDAREAISKLENTYPNFANTRAYHRLIASLFFEESTVTDDTNS